MIKTKLTAEEFAAELEARIKNNQVMSLLDAQNDFGISRTKLFAKAKKNEGWIMKVGKYSIYLRQD